MAPKGWAWGLFLLILHSPLNRNKKRKANLLQQDDTAAKKPVRRFALLRFWQMFLCLPRILPRIFADFRLETFGWPFQTVAYCLLEAGARFQASQIEGWLENVVLSSYQCSGWTQSRGAGLWPTSSAISGGIFHRVGNANVLGETSNHGRRCHRLSRNWYVVALSSKLRCLRIPLALGKTYFSLYVLLNRLSLGLPTAIQFGEDVILFTDSGPVFHNGLRIISFPSGTWALVDSGSGRGQPCFAFQRSPRSDVFLVQTTPPQPDRYKEWLKQRMGARMFVMECVTDVELKALRWVDLKKFLREYLFTRYQRALFPWRRQNYGAL